MQADGLIFVTMVALGAELINIFMTHTLTKSVENKQTKKYSKIIDTYKEKIHLKEKSIAEYEKLKNESVTALYKANAKIKAYEKKFGVISDKDTEVEKKKAKPEPLEKTEEKSEPEEFVDLPAGSNRKQISDNN